MFCQASLQQAMRDAVAELGCPWSLVGDRAPPPLPSLSGAISMPYADNAKVRIVTTAAGRLHFRSLVETLERRGFTLRDHVCAESQLDFLGYHFDGDSRVLGHTHKRVWRLH